MRTSTGLLIILIAALVAAASIPSPVRTSGWQQLKDPSTPGLWHLFLEGMGLTSGSQQWNGSDDLRTLPNPIRMIQRWLTWPAGMLTRPLW